MVWTPPAVPPNTRANNTPLPTNMPADINMISDALTAIINVLGTNPEGDAASITALVDIIDPADAIIAVGGSTAPTGWHLCNGDAVSRTTYAATFARIGTTYGIGDGSTTFNLPDLRSKFVAGKGLATWSDALTDTGGSKDAVAVAHTHSFVHDHTATQAAHNHAGSYIEGTWIAGATANPSGTVSAPDFPGAEARANGVLNVLSNTPTVTVSNNPSTDKTTLQSPTSTGTDANLPPYQTLNYCIRLR